MLASSLLFLLLVAGKHQTWNNLFNFFLNGGKSFASIDLLRRILQEDSKTAKPQI
jgi:hypothetical protein